MGVKAELPPRARRILSLAEVMRVFDGTTSACAENTNPLHSLKGKPWNYLRVRGEYYIFYYTRLTGVELPPRARRIP